MATRKSTAPAEAHLKSVPSIPAEAFAVEVARVGAFRNTPCGKAFTAANDALSASVACLDVVIRSLDADDGYEHEVAVLTMAMERLQAAQESLEAAESAARATMPGEGAQS